ncbi:extracellular solute-binding protein [bacterium]|nr:extracellular solute-binding protein [bacterium]MCB2179004.1 extracellular solute-binding protein [bacterium]
MTKKTWSILGILVIALFLLTACGGGEEAVSGKIVLWHALKDTETAGLNTIIANFQEANPDTEFEVLFVPFDDLRNKFETAAATGGGPDLLIGGDDWGPPMYDALLVQDVADVAVSDINEAAMQEGQYSGAQVGLPYVLKGVVMFRNQSIIAEPASDFADLQAKAEAATSGDTYGALLEIGAFFSFGHLYGLGGELMTAEGDPAFDTPEGVAWLEMLQEFKALGADNWYTDNDINLFKEGKVGVVIDGTWNLGDFYASLGEDLVIDPWPADMSGFVQTGMIYLNANTTGDNLDASKAFMSYLLSADAQAAFYAADDAFIPSNTTVAVDDPMRNQALQAFGDGVPWIVIPEMGAYWGPSETMILSVLEGEATPADALATATDSVNAALVDIRGQ